jgi:hypothetical protein
MQELYEFRINNDYANHLLIKEHGTNLGPVTIVQIKRDDPLFEKIKLLKEKIDGQRLPPLFFYSEVIRKHTEREYQNADLLQINIQKTFEPCGEQNGTTYDESKACVICGVNAVQINELRLKQSSIPKKDISNTIAGEVVVSKRFKLVAEKNESKGISFLPVICNQKMSEDYFQMIVTSPEISLSKKTLAGVNVFDFSTENKGEIFKCPKGHTMGLNQLSEAFISATSKFNEFDFFQSREKLGVRRGLLRPYPLYFCSPFFRKVIISEKLSGFNFDVARICNDFS